ncbi:MAG: TRAP transporter large permease [Pseudomonadota bacterium]
MSLTLVGIIGIGILLLLLAAQMPVGFSMAFCGIIGFGFVVSFSGALDILIKDFFSTYSSYGLTIIPLFVVMGYFAFEAGMSEKLYNSAYVIMGQRRGGLAMASIIACALFAAICGSTNATAATMAKVAVPEMKRFKYDMKLATGSVAAGGTLGILIPPSVLLIIYGIMTQQSIGKLFAAGIFPGILLAILFTLTIAIWVRLDPKIAPMGVKRSWKEKFTALGGMADTILIFALIIGGLLGGAFTSPEAGGVGAFLVLGMALLRRKLTWKSLLQSLIGAAITTCMIMIIVAGAMIFGHFLAVTRIPTSLTEWIGTLPLPRDAIISIIVLMYFLGGCFMDALALVMLTIPIIYPLVMSLGYDPIWFGIIAVLVTEIGVITPPVGINVYVVKGVVQTESLGTIFKGVLPFVLALFVCVAIMLIFPQIALFLPGLLSF